MEKEKKMQNQPKAHYVNYIQVSQTVEYANRNYSGSTNNLKRRTRQHNGDLVGGARYTRVGRPYAPACHIEGFGESKQHSLQFEAARKPRNCRDPLKLTRSNGRAVLPSIGRLYRVCLRKQWTKRSPPAATVPLTIVWYQPEHAPREWIPDLPAHIHTRLATAEEKQRVGIRA